MTGKRFCTKVDELAVKYGQTPKEAMPVIKDDGTVEFTEGVPYLVFDRPKLVEIVGNALVSEDTDAVEIPVTEEKMPMLTKERLKNFNTVLGVYTTNFGESPNRNRNIELAAEASEGLWWIRVPYFPITMLQENGLRTRDTWKRLSL